MLPENPFLQLTLSRAAKALTRLQTMIWKEVAEVRCSFAGSNASPISIEAAKKLKFKPVQLPYHWGKLFDQGWFRLEIPQMKKTAGPLYLHWEDQGEGTMYHGDVPFYGFDVAHRYCALPKGASEIYIEGLCLQSAIWHPAATGLDPAGSRLTKAALAVRDDDAWEAWHDLRMLYEIMLEEAKADNFPVPPKFQNFGYHPPLNNVSPLHRRLLRAMDDAVNALDSGGLPAMLKCLKAAYQKLHGSHERIKAILTGHAHIDLVWLWPERTSEYKSVHTFSTMNRLMDSYPEFVFGFSQPAAYKAVERISPGLMASVKKRIRAGKWEALGATEVESDTLIACGEALARSFLLGQKSFKRLQGKASRVLWLPDVFGYSGCLPQIMRQTGVDYFFTTKLTWSNIHFFPHSSFLWRGTDGSEVVVHVTQENGYNQIVSPEELRRGARAYRQADVHDEFLAPTGYGDGGGGVTEEMCERARRVQSLAGMPETAWGRVDAFFDNLNRVRSKLPAWQGELYLEYSRGVLTTHGDLKARFRECERSLQTWEAVRCATGGAELEDQPWERMVFAQFHDYIPGSSIWEVYENGLPELAAISSHAVTNAAEELGKGGAPAMFNPLPVERIVILDSGSRAVRLPPLSGGPMAALPEAVPAKPVQVTVKKITSGLVSASFDAKGRITTLKFGNDEIALHSPLGDLALYPDFPHDFEAWEIDRQTLAMANIVDTPAKASVVCQNDFEATVEFQRKLGKRSTVAVRYRLDAFQPVVHVEYDIDWHEEQTLLKALFPTAYTGRMARFGAPFGSVLRGQLAGQPYDEAMFESAGSRWAIVTNDDGSEGLGVVTQAKYGFSCRDGTLGVSLLRSPRVTGEDFEHRRLFPPALRRGGVRPTYSDQGRHVIRMALCLHTPALAREHLAPVLADTLFTSPLSYRGPAASAGLLGIEGCDSLAPCWAKPAANGKGWILRLHETMGRQGKARVRLMEGWKSFKTTLLEEPGQAVTEIRVKPYELISLRIVRM